MIWIPEEERKQLQKIENDCFLMAMDLLQIPDTEEKERFVFVNCIFPYGICMERFSDKQIFEMKSTGVPDLEKPVDKSFFKRYSTGHDL